jgi:hypothetical protein
VPPRHLAFREVGLVAAAEGVHLLLRQVQLDHGRDRPRQELAVVAHQHGPGTQPGHERLQAREAVQVQVVRRLVQQEDVVAGQQERRHARPGRLATGQRRHERVQADGETEVRGHLVHALVQVGATEGQPAFERGRVVLVGTRRAFRERDGRLVHRGLREGDPGAAAQEGADGLTRPAVRFLGQVADGRGRRVQPHGALVRRQDATQDPEQRRLARAVHADQADHVAGRHHEVEPGEQHPLPEPARQPLAHQCRTHQERD